jgi:pimeloyl-ACP methyl ester carboxylesterase
VIARARTNGERALERFTQLLPAPDVEVMARPAVHAQALDFVERFTLADARTGIQDMAMGARDWGFGLEDITVPVHLWHGDLDRNIPIAHAELQASLIPNATLHRCPGEGHSLYVDHMREILETLMTAAPPRR